MIRAIFDQLELNPYNGFTINGSLPPQEAHEVMEAAIMATLGHYIEPIELSVRGVASATTLEDQEIKVSRGSVNAHLTLPLDAASIFELSYKHEQRSTNVRPNSYIDVAMTIGKGILNGGKLLKNYRELANIPLDGGTFAVTKDTSDKRYSFVISQYILD